MAAGIVKLPWANLRILVVWENFRQTIESVRAKEIVQVTAAPTADTTKRACPAEDYWGNLTGR